MSDEKDKNENVVIAIFDDEESANESIEGLKQWDRVNDEIKLGAIGTITDLSPYPKPVESGSRVRVAEISLGSEQSALVPVANLELIR